MPIRSNPIHEGFLLFVGNALHSIQPLQFTDASDDGTAFYKSLVDNLYDGVYFVDLERTITYWNHGAERLTGYSASDAVGKSCFDNFLMHVDEKGCALCVHGCPLQRTISDGQPREAEVYLRHKLGHRVPVSVRAAPIRDNTGRITGAVEVFTDITAKKVVERRAGELEGFAYLDSLTGTYNRRLMQLKVHQSLEEVQQFGRGMGLLMLDVDDFKHVNDTWGHEAGDLALQAIARTLQRCLRPTDLVGRWGGEEFLVVIVNTQANTVELTKIAERCRMLVANNAVTFSGENLRITASVGATPLLAGDTSQSALRRVDELLYSSKAAGRNRSSVG